MTHGRILLGLALAASSLAHCRCNEEPLNERAPPTLEATPDALDFGNVPVGIRATRAVRVRNGGELDLEVTATATEGSPAFSAVVTPFSLRALEEGSIEVVFTPTNNGAATGTLVITSNAQNGPATRIPLTGNGVGNTVCGPCNDPPAPVCLSPTELLVHDPVGTCANNGCRYAARSVTCPVECINGACVPPLDAGPPPPPADAGVVGDAAVPDAAVPPVDAGMPDAAVPPVDAGVRPDGGNPFTGPCGPPIIVPYVEGGAFGGFQSVEGSSYQQTIRITFNCVVDTVTVTIADPDFPGNVMNAYRNGALVASAMFTGDAMPGMFTEDTQTVTAAEIDEVLLVPDPVDYVAYRLVEYTAP